MTFCESAILEIHQSELEFPPNGPYQVRLGSENSSGGGGAGAGGVWKSGNVCWHQNWSEMGPYGSIWLNTAAKMIVRTLRILFVFKKSLKIGLGVQKRGPCTPRKFCLGV